jgi:hypothetical protein
MRNGTRRKDRGTVGSLLSVRKLFETKKIALRRRVWFKSLSAIERAAVNLTLGVVSNIKSAKLAKVLTAIIDKLKTAMESRLDRLVGTIGFQLAIKISRIAVSWGNGNALLWAKDWKFAEYLALNFGKFGDVKF